MSYSVFVCPSLQMSVSELFKVYGQVSTLLGKDWINVFYVSRKCNVLVFKD